MNTAPHPSPRTTEQASLWAARLDGSTLSAADRTALDAWLAADASHRPLLSSFCQFSADLEQQLPLLAGVRDELAETPTASRTVRPLPWLSRPLWAGAALAAAAVLAVFLWPDRPQDHSQNLGTTVASRQTYTLADGTRLELNARSAALVSFTPTERRVRLSGGEAFFLVTKDPARPFFVETPAGSVRVTGTQFNVRTDSPASLEVTVLEGAVQVRPGGGGTRLLGAGDQLVCAPDAVHLTTLTARQLEDTLAWRLGQIVFPGTPLDEALACYARYHGRTLTADADAARKLVGGRYNLDDLDGFLADIAVPLGVHSTRTPDGAIHVSAAPAP